MPNELPIVRIEVENMKYQLLTAMNVRHNGLQEVIAEAVDAQLSPAAITAVVNSELPNILSAEIRSTLTEAVRDILVDPEVKESLIKNIRRAVLTSAKLGEETDKCADES